MTTNTSPKTTTKPRATKPKPPPAAKPAATKKPAKPAATEPLTGRAARIEVARLNSVKPDDLPSFKRHVHPKTGEGSHAGWGDCAASGCTWASQT
jgi:hypothetical protein